MSNLSRAEMLALVEEAERRVILGNLAEYARLIGFEPARHHMTIIREIEALLSTSDYDILLIFAPPGSAKSTYVSRALPSWYLANHPTHNVLACSHSMHLAEQFSRWNRGDVGTHGRTLKLELSTDDASVGRWSVTAGGTYRASGVGTAIMGFRADLGIIDDPAGSAEDAFSELNRGKLWDWFVTSFVTRLKPGAKVVVMHQRWHQDDLAGRLIEAAKRGEYRIKVLCIPAIAGEDDPVGREPGEYLWDDPDGFGPGRNYADLLRAQQLRQPPFEWSALYQQSPTPEEGGFFRRADWGWYDDAPGSLVHYRASDYAVSHGRGDYTVHLVAGVDPDDNLYLIDLWRGQTTPDVWIDELLNLAGRYQTASWGEEKGVILRSLDSLITKRQNERRIYFRREPFTSATDKATRARDIQGRAAMRKIYLPRHAPWLTDFLTEAHAFPAGKHDDIVDCLSLLGRMLAGMYAPGLAIPEVQREPDDYRTWGEDPDVENSWRVQ